MFDQAIHRKMVELSNDHLYLFLELVAGIDLGSLLFGNPICGAPEPVRPFKASMTRGAAIPARRDPRKPPLCVDVGVI